MKISLVIPNFNGESILRNNLLRIISAASDAEIIIVDDASTDGSVKVIKNLKLKMQNYNAKLKMVLFLRFYLSFFIFLFKL